ncbi:Major facilitator superfamily domaingeneral substrate transporter [Penicillium desertorum]|uniref:Major facilitator superfamily domaingeneral substrate transporter n=1 Tax=Penicillium desertorum TaxID=1303715 RepID=A0A9X0BGR4_9EURO|nr:Major facilitator superfamily domaingeneral substrate transporter [Penicillium desertorum]
MGEEVNFHRNFPHFTLSSSILHTSLVLADRKVPKSSEVHKQPDEVWKQSPGRERKMGWALENTVVSTSMPTIVEDLSIGDNYIWITNVFFLTRYLIPYLQRFSPYLGSLLIRRWLTMFIVAVFTLGSGICGGANGADMLIIGRAVQGIGSGGINMIVDVIVSDLVPLRERGNFIAIVLTVYSIGSSMGPFRDTTFSQKVKRIDYIGNILIMGATAAVLCALTYGGSRYAWSSWRIIVPLVLGLVGLAIFMIFEQSRFCREPVVPPRLFKSRTSLVVFINTYLFTVLLYWVLFFIPVYFQAILGSSPARAGVQMLPITLVAIPGAVIAVIILSKFGKYKALHMVGFTILTLGMGLFAYLDRLLRCGVDHFPNHSRAWICIFNNQFNKYAYCISDASLRQLLSNGHAYQQASDTFIDSLDDPVKSEVIGVFSDSVKLVWLVSVAFCGLACILVFFEKEVPLRKELDTDYGMVEKDDIQARKRDIPDAEKAGGDTSDTLT